MNNYEKALNNLRNALISRHVTGEPSKQEWAKYHEQARMMLVRMRKEYGEIDFNMAVRLMASNEWKM